MRGFGGSAGSATAGFGGAFGEGGSAMVSDCLGVPPPGAL